LLIAKLDATDEELLEVLERVSLKSVVLTMNSKIDSDVHQLSGGEK